MQISLKQTVAIALTGIAALGALSAEADVITPSSGNGELVLFVRDVSNPSAFMRAASASRWTRS